MCIWLMRGPSHSHFNVGSKWVKGNVGSSKSAYKHTTCVLRCFSHWRLLAVTRSGGVAKSSFSTHKISTSIDSSNSISSLAAADSPTAKRQNKETCNFSFKWNCDGRWTKSQTIRKPFTTTLNESLRVSTITFMYPHHVCIVVHIPWLICPHSSCKSPDIPWKKFLHSK